MADGVEVTQGTGTTFATDDIGGIHYPRVKIAWGANNSASDASAAAPLPVVQTGTPALPTDAATETTLAAVQAATEAIQTAVEILDNTVSGSEMQVDIVGALPAGTNNIGDVDVLSLPAIPAGDNNIGNVDIASIAAGDNNIGNVDVVTLPALPAGNNNIGDVDVASIAAGTNTIGNVGMIGRTSGGLTIYRVISAASANAAEIKGSAGQVFGGYVSNINAAVRYLKLYNMTGTPANTDTPVMTLAIPGGSTAGAGATFSWPIGIAFGTGIGIRLVTGAADNDNTGVASAEIIVNLFYA